MSNLENDRWLEYAQEHFYEALSHKNWDMARAVADDVWSKGFTSESKTMSDELNNALPVPHGYILGFLKKKNEEYKAKDLVPTLDMLISDLTQ